MASLPDLFARAQSLIDDLEDKAGSFDVEAEKAEGDREEKFADLTILLDDAASDVEVAQGKIQEAIDNEPS